MTDRRFDLQAAAGQGQSLAHPPQPDVIVIGHGRFTFGRFETDTVVFDDNVQFISVTRDDDARRLGLRVLDDIRQTFLRNAIADRFDAGVEPILGREIAVEMELKRRMRG